jgi:hypothetical protein
LSGYSIPRKLRWPVLVCGHHALSILQKFKDTTVGRHGGIIGDPEQGSNEIEATLGVAEHLNEFLKLEEGVIIQKDGSWQVVFAWEWDFGGGD